ncbi:MAG: hypothetical protein MMC23_007272 [Stictis urceolatum]|nr:hypothetical protein [Stictis urceolata]
MRSTQVALSFVISVASSLGLVQAEAFDRRPPDGWNPNNVVTAHQTVWVTQTVGPGGSRASSSVPSQTPAVPVVNPTSGNVLLESSDPNSSAPSSLANNGSPSPSVVQSQGGVVSSQGGNDGNSTSLPPSQGTGGSADMSAKCAYNGEGKGTSGTMTVTFINSMDTGLFMSFGDASGGPGAVGLSTSAVPLPTGEPYVATFNVGWSGCVAVGHGLDSRGTKFEGAIAPDFPYPSWDVSYVDGYTVPMVCSEDSLDNKPLRGCNIELWDQQNGITCDDVRNDQGKLCFNNANNQQGWTQPEDFFQACEASAYVFPKDDCATVAKTSNTIVCCIGSNCPAAVSQSGSQKRD